MQRITITIDDDLLETIDKISEQRGYASRSETLRDLVRDAVTREQAAVNSETKCYATLTYVYEHETRDLSRRLTTTQHHHHDLSVSTLHVHVDGHDCLEVSVLKGTVGEIKSFADSVVTQRGVRFGNLHLIPSEHGPHDHGPHSHD
ncbi:MULTISPECIES: nickel-responsive transcriptional regulator NikR [Rhizobium]|uniref:nickel-responsive transcriptional regulator NikR n=1 Tax=Rhizobium TaxID=379 RepID=UPI0015740BC4|nr:nickel-responsive transcriptional regulator NikR [Rhizobium rhizogenes]NTG51222.1 nickel-responsive transcriptional regulator NikR [Rhizobium rhizogenes]